MARKSEKKTPPHHIIIAVLSALVIIQAYFLYKKAEKPHPAPSQVTKKIRKTVEPPFAGYIAFVIDDWGYNASHCTFIKAIDKPFAVAILPHLPHSKDIAQCANTSGKEVMLHLPLEPHEHSEKYPRDYIISTTMDPKLANKRIVESIESIPFLSGVNNHMGSKATETAALMRQVFTELKSRKLFFVDSRVTSKSICPSLAKRMNIDFTERDIFLDNENSREAIERQFKQLAQLAKKNGSALGIGHDRTLTLQILKEQMASLTRQGFKIVSVQEYIQRQ